MFSVEIVESYFIVLTDDTNESPYKSIRASTAGNSRRSSIEMEDHDDIEAELTDLCIDEVEGRLSVLAFDNEDNDGSCTETEVKSISMKRKLTLQELKKESIGSVSI